MCAGSWLATRVCQHRAHTVTHLGLDARVYLLFTDAPNIRRGARAHFEDPFCNSCAMILFHDPFAIAVFYGFLARSVDACIIANDIISDHAQIKTPKVIVRLALDTGLFLHLILLLGPRDFT